MTYKKGYENKEEIRGKKKEEKNNKKIKKKEERKIRKKINKLSDIFPHVYG
jgi:hypothetical protein